MNPLKTQYHLKLLFDCLLNSYAQVFFSNSKIFAAVLIVVSFFDVGGGLGSVIAVLCCALLAILLKYNHQSIRDGSLTYNALMVGTAIGYSFDWNSSIFLLITVASTLTFFITVWYTVSLGSKKLPLLSAPFLLGLWIVMLGAPNFSAIHLNPKTSLSLFNYFPELFTQTTAFIDGLDWANYLHLLFRSVGAIFFQFNDLAGVLILLGLLCQSRIAFVLTIYSFSIGYGFYSGLEGNFSQLVYSYIGFNFILTGIALGGFFIVPSWRSFLLVGLVIPVNALLISGLHPLFQIIGLPLFSLPFNLIVLLTLVVVGQRYYSGGIVPVLHQEYSPEKHLYKHLRNISRYSNQTAIQLFLPVMGVWRVSQAFFGKHTHKGPFAYAFDFDVVNEQGLTYQNEGNQVEDYLCYNLPVIAAASGYVSDVKDDIDDNEVSEVNLVQNWGNSIVIKHAEGLFTKLSHLKKGSILVKPGDYVWKGQVVARCGSSGRSPEPHLHFQVQALPYVGSATLAYPFSYYLKKNQKINLKTFQYPSENDLVQNIAPTLQLTEAFTMIPGKRILVESSSSKKSETWVVYTDAWNQTYFHVENTNTVAYFVNDGSVFYFTEFYGDSKSLLFVFFQAAYKVLLGVYDEIAMHDSLIPAHQIPSGLQFLQDFIAPFYRPLKVNYQSESKIIGHSHQADFIDIKSTIAVSFKTRILKQKHFHISVENGKLKTITQKNIHKSDLKLICYEL